MHLEFAIYVIITLLMFKTPRTQGIFFPFPDKTLGTRLAASQTCNVADWWISLDRQKWSVCPKLNTYLRGFMRSDRLLGDERVGRLEEGRCCEADESVYATQPAACSNADWTSTLDG